MKSSILWDITPHSSNNNNNVYAISQQFKALGRLYDELPLYVQTRNARVGAAVVVRQVVSARGRKKEKKVCLVTLLQHFL
jgi:hypothetical protein